MYVVFFIMRF